MTLRHRITLLFVGIVAVLLLMALTVVFLLQADYTHEEFQRRLLDRAQVTGYIFLERDEMRSGAFRDFEKKYLQSLTGEILQVYDANGEVHFVAEDERVQLSDAVLARIIANKELNFRLGKRQAVGIFYRDNQGEYVIVAAAENESGNKRLQHLATIMSLIFVGSLVLIYLAGRVLAGRALAPIAALNDQVDRINAEDLHRRVDAGRLHDSEQDDLARLARTFNRLLVRLEESFASQRTFVSNASHELRTPLTASIGELQVLLTRERQPETYREGVASVLAELLQLKALINNLLDMAQTDGGLTVQQEIRLDELLWEVRESVPPALRKRVHIDLGELPEDPAALEVRGHRALLARGLGNLVDNALKYSADGQPVSLNLRYTPRQCMVQVADSGIGIAPQDLPKVFQPFFRADTARGVVGHGVGLPLARRIVELHGGRLALRSELGKGTVAEVIFAHPARKERG
ncbi:HAMP domain-containing sensor histidine kinase [Hymenobacter saemangeumensis]|uniref:histidine kinase n=1 Tax=Hymenobacter saemangeumensis TaxID=1084522 RepID=A0ABP8I1L9_9BACT